MESERDTVDALVTGACDLLERERVPAGATALCEMSLLREELRARSRTCEDVALADDLGHVAAELDDLLARLERAPGAAPALTG